MGKKVYSEGIALWNIKVIKLAEVVHNTKMIGRGFFGCGNVELYEDVLTSG